MFAVEAVKKPDPGSRSTGLPFSLRRGGFFNDPNQRLRLPHLAQSARSDPEFLYAAPLDPWSGRSPLVRFLAAQNQKKVSTTSITLYPASSTGK
jgi:hypothetical protein